MNVTIDCKSHLAGMDSAVLIRLPFRALSVFVRGSSDRRRVGNGRVPVALPVQSAEGDDVSTAGARFRQNGK